MNTFVEYLVRLLWCALIGVIAGAICAAIFTLIS